MPRLKLNFPEKYCFECELPVMIGDINYGNHLGNDAVLRLIHEARLRFLKSRGFSEISVGEGVGLIMVDAQIQFKTQAFHGDSLLIRLAVEDWNSLGFELSSLLLRISDQKEIARTKTGFVCFDYQKGRIAPVPLFFKEALSS